MFRTRFDGVKAHDNGIVLIVHIEDCQIRQILYRDALQPLYPSLPVRAALVYLDGPTLRRIEDSDLEAALDAAEPDG